jgi:hypothetical protein
MKKISILSMLTAAILISFTVISQTSSSKKMKPEPKAIQEVYENNNEETSEIVDQESLTGTWYWESSNALNNTELYLVQNGNSVTGKHCSSFSNATKLDCVSDDEENSITLSMLSNNVFEGTLKSEFSNAVVNIRVTLNPVNETIQFQQLSQPNEEYYLPNNVTMTLAQD